MPRLLTSVICLALIALTFGCSEKYETERFYSMGTFVSLTLPEKHSDLNIEVRSEMTKLENLITSETETSNKKQIFNFTGVMKELEDYGKEYSEMTDGRFSIYAYTIASLYGFHEGPFRVPTEAELEQALDNIDKMHDVKMDMGAFAKGYIVDNAAYYLKTHGVKSGMVNAGGDLYAIGDKGDRKWRVAIKHPEKTNEFISIVNLSDKALATSGDYERFFETEDGERIFHIFDATTGKNPDYYRSVSVIADTTEKADGLATVFFLLPKEDIEKQCKRLKTPVLLYTKKEKRIKLCGWEHFENN